MELKPEAIAIAQLDAICDEFEEAFRCGELASDIRNTDALNVWVARVDPELQTWLRDELVALHEELAADSEADDSDGPAIPEGVDLLSWNAVNHCSTFASLSFDLKRSLAERVDHREFHHGSVLLRSGQPASGLYLITSGRVQVTHGEDSDRREIDTDEAGSVVGEMSMLTGYPCSADVVATTPVQALVLPKEEFESLRNDSPELEIALSWLVSQRLGQHRHDALCGKSLAGYTLKRCIGRGAMGVVYEAIDEADRSQCALKMLPHRFLFRPDVVSRFDQETDLLRQLDHPNIVAFRDHFVAYRTRFIVLDLCDGADLQTAIRCHGPLTEATARGVLGQIAAGLLYAHQQGVLHLDLKPANILVNRDGRIAITDFGLSRLIESAAEDKTLVGTPLYMPPEQFLMEDLGPHCDWYSLACIMYELMAGQRLFQNDDSTALLDAKFNAPSTRWPIVAGASDEYVEHLRGALEPSAQLRWLDLATMASWAQPVPEISVDPEQSTTFPQQNGAS